MIYLIAPAALSAAGLIGITLTVAAVEVNFQTCEQQLEALPRPDVDCVVEIHPGALSDIPQVLKSLLEGASCNILLRFREAQVYSEWITDRVATSPVFTATCSLTASECARTGAEGSCVPVLRDVNGLGVLGRALDSYVNDNAQLRA
jgi:hypothetical protein